MALKDILLRKKKNTQSDGQEEYFKDDFPPIAKQPTKKAGESKPAVKEEKPAAKKSEGKKSEIKKTEAKKDTAKNDAPKKSANASNSAESRRVQPQPVDRIINPKNVKTEKKTATKTTDAKKTVKPAEKTTKPSDKAAKPVSQSALKATNVKELNDNSPEVKEAVAVQESNTTSNGKWDIRRAKDGRYFFSLYASNHTVIAYSQIYSSTSAVNVGINSVISNAPVAETEDTTLKKPIALPCPKWEIYLDKAGEYRFRLYAPNGLVVCHSSHGYSTKSGCKGGIESIKRFCSEATISKSYLK